MWLSRSWGGSLQARRATDGHPLPLAEPMRHGGAPPSCCCLTWSQPAASPDVPQVHARWGRGPARPGPESPGGRRCFCLGASSATFPMATSAHLWERATTLPRCCRARLARHWSSGQSPLPPLHHHSLSLEKPPRPHCPLRHHAPPAAAHEPSLVLTRPIRSDHGCGGWVTQEPLAKPRPSATQCHVLPSPPGVCHFVNLPEMEHGEQIAWGSCCSLLSPAQQCTGDDQRLPEARVYEFTKHSVPALQREAGWWPPFHSPDHVLGHFWKRWACLCFCGHTLVHQGTGIKGGKGPSPSVAAAEGERSRTTDTASCQRQLSPGVCWEACGSLSIFSLVFLSFLGAFKSS